MEKIVVISGDAGLMGVLEAGLQGEGCELIAGKKEELGGVDFYVEEPDLVVLDMRSSQSDRILSRLSSHPLGADIPIIALNEYGECGEWVEDLEQGASDFITHPCHDVELKAKIKTWLRVKRRLEQLKAEALIDELTGIYNRRFMESHVVAQLGEAQRYHHPFSFMILDIDHFKQVNDTLGHPFGDLVLREGAMLIRELMRKEDILARYGGEEFAIILPHTDRKGAAVLGERVRAAVAEKEFEQGEKKRQVTISIGAATYPVDPMETVEELITCADGRLYQAKESGRNRLIFE